MMECLRGQTVEGCVRTVFCNEEGCEFKRIEGLGDSGVVEITSPDNCVLQLRLRTRIAQNLDEGRGTDEDRRAFEELERDRISEDFDAGVYGARTINWHTGYQGLREELEQARKTPSISERTDGRPGPETLKALFGELEQRGENDRFFLPNVDDVGGYVRKQVNGPRPNHVYLDEYQRWVGNWEGNDDPNPEGWRPVGVHDLGEGVQSTDELSGPEGVDSSDQGEVRVRPVVSEESIGKFETHEDQFGIYTHIQPERDGDGWQKNRIKFLMENPFSPRNSSFKRPLKPAETYRFHGPHPDTEGWRLLERWDSDPDVPGYILDEFSDYLHENGGR